MARKSPGRPPSQRSGHVTRSPAKAEGEDPNDIRFIATHEAGHAVSAVVLGLPLTTVDIKRRNLLGGLISMGFTAIKPLAIQDLVGRGAEVAMPRLVQCLTGIAAEARVIVSAFKTTGQFSQEEGECWRIATFALASPITTADGMGGITREEHRRIEPQVLALIQAAEREAEQLVGVHWKAIQAVTQALLRTRVAHRCQGRRDRPGQ